MKKRIVIVGGCGHVGLPLGVKFVLAGAECTLVDINEEAIETVLSGKVPFVENGGDEQLQRALDKGLKATSDPSVCQDADVVVFVTGTPVDEHLNPKISDVLQVFDMYKKYFSEDTLIIMRSTLFPGTMEHLREKLERESICVSLAFCPERVAEGYALDEIDSLPQIVAAFDEKSFDLAYQCFRLLAPSIIRLDPIEAELTKLMANSWRYLEFAIGNQFYMIAESHGVDFYKIYQAIRHDYPRAQGYKAPGFAAGPCLFKDTMQLASYFDHQFYLGHSAMLVNEGLASFVVKKLKAKLEGSLWGKSVACLGMAFKANNDDTRESLSFKVKKSLEFEGARVLCHDPFLSDSVSIETLRTEAEALVLCTPHAEYRQNAEYEALAQKLPTVDVWGFFGKPELTILPGRASQS